MIISHSDLPNKTVDLGTPYEKIPLVTIGNSDFRRYPWLIKSFNSNTDNLTERLWNLKLNSVRIVIEKIYGMLKSRWRILYKKTEMKSLNLKYIIMACAMLHNICILRNDPCNRRWLLTVEKLELKCNNFSRHQRNKESGESGWFLNKYFWKVFCLLNFMYH